MHNLNLSELTIDNMGQWPKPVKIGAVVFLPIIISILGYLLILKAQFTKYENLKVLITFSANFSKGALIFSS